jgi:hypothetical protein
MEPPDSVIVMTKANQENNTETSHKPREAKSKIDLEEMEAMDLEESPEVQSEVEHEVPKEEATMGIYSNSPRPAE